MLRASTKPTPKPAPKPPPVGDACLVGTWRDHGYHTTTKYNGVTVQLTGGSGNVDHITASGTDTDVYGPNALPFYGTYNGSTLEEAPRVKTLSACTRIRALTGSSRSITAGP